MGSLRREKTAIALLFFVLVGCASKKLVIESEPSGGDVFINEKPMGKTPLTVSYNDLPYDENLSVRIEKEAFGTIRVYVQGPKLAGIGESVHIKLTPVADDTSELNALLDRMLSAHKLALDQRFLEAQRIIDQMIAEHPKLIAPRLLKSAIFVMAKNYSEGRQQYKEVLKLDPGNAEATKMLSYLESRAPSSSTPAGAPQ